MNTFLLITYTFLGMFLKSLLKVCPCFKRTNIQQNVYFNIFRVH